MCRALPFHSWLPSKRYRPFSFATPSFDGFANDFTIYCILFGECLQQKKWQIVPFWK